MIKFNTVLPTKKIRRIMEEVFENDLPVELHVSAVICGKARVSFKYSDPNILTRLYCDKK